MRVKKKGSTIDIRFDSREESIAMLRALGMTKSADALQAIEDKKNPPAQPGAEMQRFAEEGQEVV